MQNSADAAVQIQTPEAVRFTLDVAGPGARFAAAVIDTAIIFAGITVLSLAVTSIVALLTVFLQGETTSFIKQLFEGAAYIVVAAGFITVFLMIWGYFIFFEFSRGGATPGKRAAGLRVVKSDGSPLSFSDSAIRNLIRIVDFMPMAYFSGFLSILLTKRNQRLGDLAAGTIVVYVHDSSYVGLRDQLGREQETPLCRVPLEAAEYETVLRFVQRRRELHPQRRAQLAMRIAAAVARKYNLPLERFPNAEAFIDWMFMPEESSK